MIIMALDHTRDFFTDPSINPLDLTRTTPQLFFTRWITHYCAPVFVFLAGASSFMAVGRRESKQEAARFLLTRGLWLVFAELTIVNFGWTFNIHYGFLMLQVIWAIGWSMVVLAGLIFLPPRYIAAIGLILVIGHNALDSIKGDSFGSMKFLWSVIHEQDIFQLPGNRILLVAYPLVPWIGVMAVGYVFGNLFTIGSVKRKTILLRIGLACVSAFILLRWINVYGDPLGWHVQDTWWKTIGSFVNCQKYPPSLLYLLMTIGPAILVLAALEKTNNQQAEGKGYAILEVYGRVPFFYYLLHIYLLHSMIFVVALITHYDLRHFTNNPMGAPPGWTFNLWTVYLLWLIAVTVLYFPCKWFMKVKARRKDWWLSYL